MNTIISFATKMLFKIGLVKKIISPIAGVYQKSKGFRTQGLLIASACVYAAGFFGWMDKAQAETFAQALALMAAPTAADKLNRFVKYADMAKAELDKFKPAEPKP